MPKSLSTPAERYLRYSHRNLVALLFLTILVGALFLYMAVGDASPSRWLVRSGALLGVVAAIGLGALQRMTLRGDRWNPNVPEVQAVMQDEWRKTSMDRAMRVAFVVVLVAQIPIGLLVAGLPSLRAVMAMAVTTLTLGLATLVALYLFLSRQQQDVE